MKPSAKRLSAIIMTVMVIVFLSLSLLAGLWPTMTPTVRHVDPKAEAEQLPSTNFVMVLFSGAFDSLIGGDYNATYEKLKILGAAYIPEKYKFIVERFSRLLNDTSKLLNDVEDLLDRAEALIDLGKGENAKPLLQEASVKLATANITYTELRSACEELAKSFRLPLSEVREKVEQLGKVIEGLYARLIQLLQAIDKQRTLEDSFLTIEVKPMEVWTGGIIEVKGRLYGANGRGLAGRNVQLYIDGAKLAENVTLEEGLFEVQIHLPYIYKSRVAVQARFTPQGLDSQTYKPAASNIVQVSLSYIEPRLTVEPIEAALPGKTFTVKGLVEAEEPLPYNYVKVSWTLHSLTVNLQGGGHFNVTLYTPEDVAEGNYPLTVETPAWKVYAPLRKTFYVKVQRLSLSVQACLPFTVLAGFPSTLNGKVFYEGEQFNVTVKLVFIGQTYTASSRGEFSLNLLVPLTVLTGYQTYEIHVSPSLPWYKSVTFKGSIFVVNPFTVMFPFGFVSFLAFRFLKGKSKLEAVAEASGTVESESLVSEGWRFAPSGLEWLVDLYWQAVVLVAGLTDVEMKPSITMREYLAAVKPKLGDIGVCFEVLTAAAEKALYSKTISAKELESAKKEFEELRLASVKV